MTKSILAAVLFLLLGLALGSFGGKTYLQPSCERCGEECKDNCTPIPGPESAASVVDEGPQVAALSETTCSSTVACPTGSTEGGCAVFAGCDLGAGRCKLKLAGTTVATMKQCLPNAVRPCTTPAVARGIQRCGSNCDWPGGTGGCEPCGGPGQKCCPGGCASGQCSNVTNSPTGTCPS
jgi:hypothetical protein